MHVYDGRHADMGSEALDNCFLTWVVELRLALNIVERDHVCSTIVNARAEFKQAALRIEANRKMHACA